MDTGNLSLLLHAYVDEDSVSMNIMTAIPGKLWNTVLTFTYLQFIFKSLILKKKIDSF